MRMHSYGKFSPNLIIGALLVFSIIVLYNYWSISAVNHDLTLKIHSLEQQIISLSKTNDALQSNLEKVEEIREKVEVNLQKEQLSEQQAKEEASQKDASIKSLRNDLENSKQEALNCKDENNAANTRLEKKDHEISKLKEKVVSLQAQIVEKDNKIGRIEKELESNKNLLAKSSLSTAKSTSVKPASNGGIDKPGAPDDQPVLMMDPAVPFPSGWMKAGFLSRQGQPHVKISSEAEREKEMKPAEAVVSPPGASDKQPSKPSDQRQAANVGSGEVMGVLPVPGLPPRQQMQPQQQNLDAQEDDGDRPLKEELIQQDDQSPDGDLPHKEPKENVGVVPAPALLKDQGKNNAGGSAQQEEREAAHLRVPVDTFDTNNNL